MSYRLTFECDHDGYDRAVHLHRPEPSRLFTGHIPEGWALQRANTDPNDVYYVYCAHHKEDH